MKELNQTIIEWIQNNTQKIWDLICKIIMAALTLFYDASTVLNAVLFLIVVDQVMGVTYAISRKEFDWQIFKNVYRKVIVYMAAILGAFTYERFLLCSEEIYFTQIMGAIVGFQELSSAYLKFAKITGVEIFETIFKKIKG